MNFGLVFRDQNFSTTDISHTFVGSPRNMALLKVWPIDLTPQISWTLVRGSCDTMWRHASVFYWCTCKGVFWQLPHVCG